MSKDNFDDKHIYEALNYYSEEEIDNGEYKVDEVTAARIKQRVKGKLPKSRVSRRGIRIAIALLIVVNVALVSLGGFHVYARIGNSLIDSIADMKQDKMEYSKYSNTINKSAVSNGIRFTVNEIVSDGNQVVVACSVTSESGKLIDKVKRLDNIVPAFMANGNLAGGASCVSKEVSETRYDVCFWLEYTGEESPTKEFDLTVMLREIGEVSGDWQVKVKVNSDKIKKDVHEYRINKDVQLIYNKIKIEKIITSPLSIGIKAKGNLNGNINEFDSAILLDDSGNQIGYRGGGGGDGKVSIDYAGLVNPNTESLTLIPHTYSGKDREYKYYPINKLPIESIQGSYGKVTVNKIEWIAKDKIKVSYKINSRYPLVLMYAVNLFSEDNKWIDSDDFNSSQISPENMEDFEQVYSGLNKNKSYKIGIFDTSTEYLIREDMAVKIDLK
ncbi:MAG: DUF4179 domain-containing protein [Clostridium sp.]